MNDDAGDVVGVGQAHELPGGAGVHRFEDALTGVGGTRDVLRPCAHPDHVGVGWRDGDGAHGGRVHAVGDGVPGDAVVGGLPEAAAASGGVDRVELVAAGGLGHGNFGDPRRRAKRAEVSEGERIGHRLNAGSRLRLQWGGGNQSSNVEQHQAGCKNGNTGDTRRHVNPPERGNCTCAAGGSTVGDFRYRRGIFGLVLVGRPGSVLVGRPGSQGRRVPRR